MELLLVIFGIVVVFSLLTLIELWVLKHLGFDVIGHLLLTKDSGRDAKFLFEVFGAVAFIVAQPILLTATTVWAFTETRLHLVAAFTSLSHSVVSAVSR